MQEHTHESIPTKVRAVRIRTNPVATVAEIERVFGSATGLRVSWSSTEHVAVLVQMTTAQGLRTTALTGEWVVEEDDDRTRHYPVDADVFAARYRSL